MHSCPQLLYYYWIGGFKINLKNQCMILIIWRWFKSVDKSLLDTDNHCCITVHHLKIDKIKKVDMEREWLLEGL